MWYSQGVVKIKEFNHIENDSAIHNQDRLLKTKRLLAGVCLAATISHGCVSSSESDSPAEAAGGQIEAYFDPLTSNQACKSDLENPARYIESLLDDIGLTEAGRQIWQDIDSISLYCDQEVMNRGIALLIGNTPVSYEYFYGLSNENGLFYLTHGDKSSAVFLTLSAAYKQLQNKERQAINALLEEGYLLGKYDEELAILDFGCVVTPTAFDKADTFIGCLLPSLYIAAGALAEDLPEPLAEHYAHYFRDRKKIITRTSILQQTVAFKA